MNILMNGWGIKYTGVGKICNFQVANTFASLHTPGWESDEGRVLYNYKAKDVKQPDWHD